MIRPLTFVPGADAPMSHPIQDLQDKIAKAAVLVEALPYLQRFRGQIFVIKMGGSAMEDEDLVRSVMRDVVTLEICGINPVVVHGGGKAITAAMERSGLRAEFIDGQRVTDAASIKLVEATLNGEINPQLAQMIRDMGGRSVGIRGQEVFSAIRSPGRDASGNEIDLGFVGRVSSIRPAAVRQACREEVVPVVSPVGADDEGGELPLNVNADLAASALARELRAAKLVYLSDVLGVMRDAKDPSTLIPSLTPQDVDALIADGVIRGGMIPKVRSSVEALHAGVGKVHMIDGRIPHSVLLEVFTDRGIGTELVARRD
jgi:acetylglutamate kinase